MSAQVISIRPSDAELEDAWQAFDAAQRHVIDLYRDDASASDDRRAAVVEANRLHTAFKLLCERAEGK